jgi:methyl-accepting chemotaxis protein
MKSLERLRIRTRLVIGFIAVFTLLAAAAATAVWKLDQLRATVNLLVTRHAAKLAAAERWERGIAVNQVRTHNVLVLDDAALIAQMRRDIEATSKDINAAQKEVESLASGEAERREIDSIAARRSQYRDLREALIKRRGAGEDVRAELGATLEPLSAAYLGEVRSFVDMQQQALEGAKQAADDDVSRARLTVIAILVAGLVAALFAAASIAASVVRRIDAARQSCLRIAQGDLTERLDAAGHDEVGEMLAALREMQESLNRIASKVRGTAEAVSSASTQIAAGNTDLSARTEEQASNLQETAASIEEMTAAVTQNAQSAVAANELAASAVHVAQRGGDAVSEVVKTMEGIQASSHKIGEITGLIDSIAFQTNILALNAAVEAARAGESGRGFAVVAAEVRNLAQRAGEAAREINTLITESVERADAGARIADGAGATMSEIVASVNEVSKIISEIANATAEQSSGITQASAAVSQLDKATQANAALVEQSTAASESLRRLAVDMSEAVGAFRVSERSLLPSP